MHREWHLNPPPNWPVPPGTRIGLDWRPNPAWGPPPSGWQLWQRSRRHRPVAAPALAALVLGALLGATAVAPRSEGPAPAIVATAGRRPLTGNGPSDRGDGASSPGHRGPVTGPRPAMPGGPRIALTVARLLPAPCAARGPRGGDHQGSPGCR